MTEKEVHFKDCLWCNGTGNICGICFEPHPCVCERIGGRSEKHDCQECDAYLFPDRKVREEKQ